MRKFRDTLRTNNLFDLDFKGSSYTFSNRGMGVQEYKARLDRVLTTESWRNKFSKANVAHVATMTSDHYLLMIGLSDTIITRGTKQGRGLEVKSLRTTSVISGLLISCKTFLYKSNLRNAR